MRQDIKQIEDIINKIEAEVSTEAAMTILNNILDELLNVISITTHMQNKQEAQKKIQV